MNNSGSDNSVGTKNEQPDNESNSAQLHGIDFRPKAKRFKMWNKEDNSWLFDGKIFTIPELVIEFGRVPVIFESCELVQSTNMFGIHGEEIFEGDLIKIFPKDISQTKVGWVKADLDGRWNINYLKQFHDGLLPLVRKGPDFKIVGHILSNPELLEEGR